MFVNAKFKINNYTKDVDIDGEKYHLFHLQQYSYQEQQCDLKNLNQDKDKVDEVPIVHTPDEEVKLEDINVFVVEQLGEDNISIAKAKKKFHID